MIPRCLLLGGCLLAGAAAAEGVVTGDDRVQVFIGATSLSDQTGELQNDSGEPVDIDFSNLPTIGLEVETPYFSKDSGLEFGINAGGGISWRGSDTRFVGKIDSSGSVVYFRVDNEFLLVEGHIGGYLRAHLGKTADFYLGAGPAVIFASHSVEDDETEEEGPIVQQGTIVLESNDSSDFALGYYARAGIEFDLGNQAQWGFGVRYLGGDMDFDDTVGSFDIEGLQYLITYSAWY